METQGWDACLCDVSSDSPRRPMCLPCPPLCQRAGQEVELDTGQSTSSERLPLTEGWLWASFCGHQSELWTASSDGGRPHGGRTGQGPTRESGWRREQKVQCAPRTLQHGSTTPRLPGSRVVSRSVFTVCESPSCQSLKKYSPLSLSPTNVHDDIVSRMCIPVEHTGHLLELLTLQHARCRTRRLRLLEGRWRLEGLTDVTSST